MCLKINGLNWCCDPKVKCAEVIVNDDYKGVYIFTHKSKTEDITLEQAEYIESVLQI